MGYLVFGGLVTATLALLPFCFRLAQQLDVARLNSVTLNELAVMAAGKPSAHSLVFFCITTVERVFLSGLFFFMMCVAERTYKQVPGLLLCSSKRLPCFWIVFIGGVGAGLHTLHFKEFDVVHSGCSSLNSSVTSRQLAKPKNLQSLTLD